MQIDLTSLGIGGMLVWLLGWVSKHFLDRLLLPRVLDWWARQNQRWALQRAEQLLNLFTTELQRASDTRHLILHLEDRMTVIVCFVGAANVLLLIMVLLQQIVPESERPQPERVLSLLAILFILAFFLGGVFLTNRRLVSIFTNPNKHRDDMIARITSLLIAAGLSEDDIRVWLERVPPIPASLKSLQTPSV